MVSTFLLFGFNLDSEVTPLGDEVPVEPKVEFSDEVVAADFLAFELLSFDSEADLLGEQSSCTVGVSNTMNCDLQLINDGDGNADSCAQMLCTTNQCCANSCTPFESY